MGYCLSSLPLFCFLFSLVSVCILLSLHVSLYINVFLCLSLPLYVCLSLSSSVSLSLSLSSILPLCLLLLPVSMTPYVSIRLHFSPYVSAVSLSLQCTYCMADNWTLRLLTILQMVPKYITLSLSPCLHLSCSLSAYVYVCLCLFLPLSSITCFAA